MAKDLMKTVRVGHGLFSNKPNQKRINKISQKLGKQGYKLFQIENHQVGCLKLLFTFGWARGHTELTFVRED